MPEPVSPLFHLAAALLAELGWPSVELDEGSAIGTAWDDGTTTYRSLFLVDGGSELVFYTQAPEPVPAEFRTAAALLLTRANWGLPTVAFELDLDTGEVRVRCGLDLGEGAVPTVDLLRPAVLANLAASTVYLPGLALVAGGADPDTVIAAIEGQ